MFLNRIFKCVTVNQVMLKLMFILNPTNKVRLAACCRDSLHSLQEQFVELESLGVLSRTEDLVVTFIFSCQKTQRRTSYCNKFC